MTSPDDFKLDPSPTKIVEVYRKALAVSKAYGALVMDDVNEIRSTIHQSIEITNGNFTFTISSDGEFIKIERKGGQHASRSPGGFFLIPIEMWDEVVNFVFQETQRRKADAED
jgi:hypothetical protein